MGSRKTHEGAEAIYAAAQKWVDCALRKDDSLFTPGKPIWTPEGLRKLREQFLDQPDVGQGGFYDKLRQQLEGSPPEVYQLMGEVLYFHFLIIWPGTMRGNTKVSRINEVLGWSEETIEVPPELVAPLSSGIANMGQGRSRYFPFYVGFIAEFAERWKELEPDERQRLLAEPWEFRAFATTQVELRGRLFHEAPNAHRPQLEALLHLVHPGSFEGTVSVAQKQDIAGAKAFQDFVTDQSTDVDRKIARIRQGLEAGLGRDFDFYDDDIEIQWNPKRQTWDEFIKRAKEYVASGRLETEEIGYKREMGEDLAAARRAVLGGAANWVDLLKHALRTRSGHPIAWPLLSDFNKWCSENPAEALGALQALWAEGGPLDAAGRIRAFYDRFPRSALRGAEGNSANVASVLLMGLDVDQYPPFRVGVFNNAYDLTGYGRQERGADEGNLYQHALGFLDRFIEEASERGLELRHRLDAQSVVWGMPEEGITAPVEPPMEPPPPQGLDGVATQVYLPIKFLEEIEALLDDKKQVIFQGPPGTGKTYVAQKLARHLAGSDERVTLVQLHPSYAYEDFVQGFRPTLNNDGQPGFELRDGPLLRAANLARQAPDEKHFLVIDEINRGNLAKVLGELYFLLEYRDKEIRLQYHSDAEEGFSLPPNLYFIGTMNTADRSIALVDLALRRRFYFVEFHPDDEPVKGVLRRWIGENAPGMEWVANVVERANRLLQDDRHAAIGPSYFMKDGLDETRVERIWKHSVLPYVEERLFGDDDRIREFDLNALRGAEDPDGRGTATSSEEETAKDEDVAETDAELL